jgi:nicotinamidase-related amidase
MESKATAHVPMESAVRTLRCCYYEKWRQATREHVDPRLLELMPPLPNLAPPALVIDKPVYSVFAAHDELMRRRSDTLILTGAGTDVCVLSTALGAIDHGYRVIVAEDAVRSSSDHGPDSLLALFAQRFSQQLEVADTQTILTAWAVV